MSSRKLDHELANWRLLRVLLLAFPVRAEGAVVSNGIVDARLVRATNILSDVDHRTNIVLPEERCHLLLDFMICRYLAADPAAVDWLAVRVWEHGGHDHRRRRLVGSVHRDAADRVAMPGRVIPVSV